MTEDTVYSIKGLAAHQVGVLGLISQLLFKEGTYSLSADSGKKLGHGR